jgi:3-hydroxyisobutyrate dehydrogenase
MTITHIGVVGLGSMGSAMAQRLVGAGYHVTINDPTRDKPFQLAPPGARTATLPADAAQDADLVVVSVRGEGAIDEVLFDHGSIGETLRNGGYILDTSTTSPQFSRAATARLAGYGLTRLEGCVLGDPARARLGQVRMLFGGFSCGASAAALRPGDRGRTGAARRRAGRSPGVDVRRWHRASESVRHSPPFWLHHG